MNFKVVMIVMKRLVRVPALLFLLFTLSGCPLMMPFMMVPSYSKSLSKPGELMEEAALNDLIEEGISGLSSNLGPYNPLLLGEVKVTEDLISKRRFQQTLLREL